MKLETQITQLENAQLVRRTDDPEPAYLFKHTLTQETAYESMLLKKRREIHLRVAQAYEAMYADRLDENAAVLAQHYAEAGDDAKTLEYATRAGDAAALTYASTEAVVHYRRALDIAKRDDRRAPLSRLIHLYTRLGRMLELAGRYQEAIRNYQDMEQLALERAEPRLELEALLARATLYVTPTPVFNSEEGHALSDRALGLARELSDHAAEARLLWNLELLYGFTARPEESLRYGEQSVALAREFNLREQLAFSLSDLNFAYFPLGQPERGQEALEEGLGLWQELDNKPMLANSLAGLAENNYLLGEIEQSLAQGAEALDISQAIGNLWGQSYSQMLTGYVYWERGDPARAIETMNACIRLAEQAGFMVPQILTRADLGLIYASLGAGEYGLELVRKAHEVAGHTVVFSDWMWAHLVRALIFAGKLKEADETFRQKNSRFPRGRLENLYPLVAFGVLLPEVELPLYHRDYARAAPAAERLVEYLKERKVRAYLPEALYLSGQAALGQGEAEQARLRLGEARAAAEALGSRRMLWQILAALGEIESRRGNQAEADELQKQARAIVEYVADRTPIELRGSFLNLPGALRLLEGP